MESTAWVSYTVACLAMAALFLLSGRFIIFRQRRKLNLPLGPRPLPIIGNLHQMGSLPYRTLYQLSKKYGEIMQLRFGSVPIVVASSAEMAKIFLHTMDHMFACRPQFSAGKYTAFDYSNVFWSPYGPYFVAVRKMLQTELLNPKRLDLLEYIRVEEVNSLIKNVYESSGQVLPFKHLISTLNWNVISRMVLGERYADRSFENSVLSPKEFKEMLNELVELNGVFNLGDYIPWMAFMDLQGYVRRMRAVSSKFDRFLEHVVEEHNARRRKLGVEKEKEKDVAKDMMDVLLQVADSPNLDVKIGRKEVKAIVQALHVGGIETNTTTQDWAMSELLKNPKIIEKATAELDRVIGRDRWVEEKDLPNLPYIDGIIKETLRVHPIAPLMGPHRAREDCKVAGYDISQGTLVIVNIWALGRDPTFWDSPNEFLPERFIGKEIDIKGHNFHLLPFGSGRRVCAGYNLALKVLGLSLANLLHGFNWKLPSTMNKEDLDMEETFSIVCGRKTTLFTVAEPRLAPEMYAI